MACLFTRDGLAARRFRYEAEVGNVGINVGVAAPMAFFPFSGWKESFFGDLHAQGRDAIDFYTEKKIVVERWPSEWSRQFLPEILSRRRLPTREHLGPELPYPAVRRGSVNVIVVPFSTMLSARISPPCAATRFRAMVSPSPEPRDP